MLDVPLDHRVTALVRRSTGTGLRSARKYSRGNTRGAPVVWASGDGTPEPFQEDDSMTASTAVSQLLARWAHLYGHTPVSATVTYLHLVGILVGAAWPSRPIARRSGSRQRRRTGPRSWPALAACTAGW